MNSLKELSTVRARLRAEGKVVVFTNGVFDLLHAGHIDYLQRAKDLGDVLIVGLNSDASTKILKGHTRPIVPQEERVQVLAALACVDYVIIFDETTANALVKILKPDIYVKGGDWGQGRVPPEAEIVDSYGGQVHILPYLPGHSTTRLIEATLRRHTKPKYNFDFRRDVFHLQHLVDLLEATLVVVISLLYVPYGLVRCWASSLKDRLT